MELKKYQQRVLENIRAYAEKYVVLGNAKAAYDAHLAVDGLTPGTNGVGVYKDRLGGIPNVCIKVPTGGGKTFIAANSVGVICDELPEAPADVVVWLVPRKEILAQTLRQLRDPGNFLRMALDRDFAHRVEVLDKEDGLRGRGFTRDTVEDQLTLFVLSYDSFKKNKDGRRAYAENSALVPLTDYQKRTNQAVDIDGADDTALISALAGTNPIVIVDESHHATSDLSINMLQNLNPRFVLELTATPRDGANVICRVKATELKDEEMVKLPVVVYRRDGRDAVVQDAIMLQRRLELAAKDAETKGGGYIRPIVLFQAERRGLEDERGTYEKLKTALLEIGIPEEQIAVRTGDVDDIKGRDLMDPGCPVRFIITVDALAEGWDCPFAYVLASVANRNSRVSVEQIVGRVLRQPYARRSLARCLNISYVLTSSADFSETIDQVVNGLNGAGFSNRDVVEGSSSASVTTSEGSQTQIDLAGAAASDVLDDDEFRLQPVDCVLSSLEPGAGAGDEISPSSHCDVDAILADAEANEERMRAQAAKEGDHAPGSSTGMGGGSNVFGIRRDIAEEIEALRLPQYRTNVDAGLWSFGDTQPFDKSQLMDKFDLGQCSTSNVHVDMYDFEDARQVDVDYDSGEFKVRQLPQSDVEQLRGLFAGYSEQSKRVNVRDGIISLMSLQFLNTYSNRGLKQYVGRVVDGMTDDQVMGYIDNSRRYAEAVVAAIKQESEAWCSERFKRLFDAGTITLESCYKLPAEFVPKKPVTRYDRTLYDAEDGGMNNLEQRMADALANALNIRWWHRIMESKRGEFCINGFIKHYPDFIAETVGGMIMAIETKGEHLKNDDSAAKLKLGRAWAANASGMEGRRYRYFMVFESNPLNADGAYDFNEFRSTLNDMA
ncbi:DEAD/DEAH box helicase family protein [uncultured Parolsenella sp.]|uniref:DEAD/DEAH box helicase n=1 Tax=uncultured Parolsenella sp. TaxID=2083008 RepID=UPI0025CB8387|nr:DEAD/DEAH box helicase family protein [uncultured Parolsenella sp.]